MFLYKGLISLKIVFVAVAALAKVLLLIHSIGTALFVLGIIGFLVAAGIALVAILVVSLVVLLIHKSCLLFVVFSLHRENFDFLS
jgi:hypothetical protein